MSCSPLARAVGRGLQLIDQADDLLVELAAQPVLAVVDHVVEHGAGAVEEPDEDAVLHRPREPPRGLVAQALVQVLPMLVEVAVEALEGRVHHLLMAAVARERAEDASRGRNDRRRFEAVAHQALGDVVHVLVLEEVHHLDRTAEHVPGEPVGVGRIGQPPGDPITDVGGAHPFCDGIPGEEARLDELAERLAELGLALGDDGGVGDGHAERVAEQRDDGEPVGEPADHRGLGRGLHVAEQRCRRRRRRRPCR